MSEADSVEGEEGITVPSNSKTYIVQDRRIVTQYPKRDKSTNLRESYDGPKEVK